MKHENLVLSTELIKVELSLSEQRRRLAFHNGNSTFITSFDSGLVNPAS